MTKKGVSIYGRRPVDRVWDQFKEWVRGDIGRADSVNPQFEDDDDDVRVQRSSIVTKRSSI